MVYAYVWASGLVEIGYDFPEGSLVAWHGEDAREKELDRCLSALCRLTKTKPTQYLCPGIPESTDEDEAYEAFLALSERVKDRMESGVFAEVTDETK